MNVYTQLSAASFVTGQKADPHAAYRPILNMLHEVFEKADLDSSGTLSQFEFVRAFSQDDVVAQCLKLGLRMSDVRLVFRRCDRDGDGELSLAEITDGFIAMKQATKGMERILAFIDQTFTQADFDN